MQLLILRYSDKVNEYLPEIKSNAKPEPWLHIAVAIDKGDNKQVKLSYAIYVWDSRKVIDSNEVSMPIYKYVKFLQTISLQKRREALFTANDNHKDLQGGGKPASMINTAFATASNESMLTW